METNNRIDIKRFIRLHPSLAEGLKRNSLSFDNSIKELALFTKINEQFLIMNIDRIRNWID